MRHVLLVLALLASPFALAAARADVPPTVGTSACGGTEPAHIVPVLATHTLPPYPSDAVKSNEQGNSILRVAIAPNGAVVEDSIVQSSGSEQLDAAALDHVKRNWRWQPMPGCRTPVSVAVSVAWRLRGPVSPMDPQIMVKLIRFVAAPSEAWPADAARTRAIVMLMGSVSDTGEWHKLLVMPNMGDAALFNASDAVAAARKWMPLRLDGKAVPSLAIVGVVWTPPGEKPVDPDQLPGMIEMLLPHNMAAPPRP